MGVSPSSCPAPLARSFEAVVFVWEGTAVEHRRANVAGVRRRVEALCDVGVHLGLVSRNDVDEVDGQLAARPAGPGTLHLLLNGGSEVHECTTEGPRLLWRRDADTSETEALDVAAAATAARLRRSGLGVQVVNRGRNGRRIDLVAELPRADSVEAPIDERLEAVVRQLQGAGLQLRDVVAVAEQEARLAGLVDARVTSDLAHVDIGLTDNGDSARWMAAMLSARGIGGGLVLIAGNEFGSRDGVPGSDGQMLIAELSRATVVSVGVERGGGVPAGVTCVGGGAPRFAALLDEQLARRSLHRVPNVDEDARWTIELPTPDRGIPAGVQEALLTLADGVIGTRGVLEEDARDGDGSVMAAGAYTDSGGGVIPVPMPSWVAAGVAAQRGRRVLDMHCGLLARESVDGVRSLRLVSAYRPGVTAMRVEAPPAGVEPGAALRPCRVRSPDSCETLVHTPRGGSIAAAAAQTLHRGPNADVLERIAAYVKQSPAPAAAGSAREQLAAAISAGFDTLLAEQRQEWARRWGDAVVSIRGDANTELAVRFALFHLLSSVPEAGEAAVGARGLTGPAYAGHVFWDADVFVLPFLAATRPSSARAMLQYRIARLGAARRRARRAGFAGALWPWESADDGEDVTPSYAIDRDGRRFAIRTGDNEEHIVADIAWAACHYASWSGDDGFLAGPGHSLVLEGARYWASRVRRDEDGAAHIYGVIGPDEYHDVVDDNAYTNVMARWNLRAAAELARAAGAADLAEINRWCDIADALVDGYDAASGVYEQFDGFFDLTPLVISDVAQPPVAADLLLGRDVVRGSQVVKQADVLMLHHLVPGEVAFRSLVPNLAYYAPRTAHGSSLSPAIHAALWARAGEPDRALDLLRIALRLDLDDRTGMTAGGLHLATFGGVWQALAHGFLGLSTHGTALAVDPMLPGAWDRIGMVVRFRGTRVKLHATHDQLRVECTQPIIVRLPTGEVTKVEPPGGLWPVLPGREGRAS